MTLWFLSFQAHSADGPLIRSRQLLRDYVTRNDDVKSGDLAYWIAGSDGFCGWGYVKTARRNGDESKMFVEVMFHQLQGNISTQEDISANPVLTELRSRAVGNFTLLKPKEINELNRILREKGLDAPEDVPEFEVRFGKFGFKETTSLSHEAQTAATTHGSVSLLFLDLDNFKAVNDDNSYQVGDDVIRAALNEIQEVVAGRGEVFHRSGDEIIVLLPNVDQRSAIQIAEELRHSVEKKEFPVIGASFVSASIGTATYPEDCSQVSRLEEIANDRLKVSKKSGKNRVSTVG